MLASVPAPAAQARITVSISSVVYSRIHLSQHGKGHKYSMSDQIKAKKNSFPKIFLWGMGIFLLVCSGLLFLLWYLPLDPVSPPSTQLGKEPTFDDVLASGNAKCLFLFRRENKIITTDIYGGNEKVVFDIVTATNNVNSELLDNESISPDGRLLAINYFNERNLSDYWHPPIGKLIFFDIENGVIENIPTVLDGFEFDWITPVHWLNSDVFLVKMHRFPGKDMFSEEVRFLRYDLKSLQSFQVIEFSPCSLTTTMKSDSHVLLLASDCDFVTESTIYAIDINGKRLATHDEFVFFEKCISEWQLGENCDKYLSTYEVAKIRTDSVTGNMVDGFGRWYDNNWYRDNIYLNDKLVRISDGWVEFDPVWDPGLDLFTWDEGYQTYQMDSKGHYRYWYDGKYIGKVPRK